MTGGVGTGLPGPGQYNRSVLERFPLRAPVHSSIGTPLRPLRRWAVTALSALSLACGATGLAAQESDDVARLIQAGKSGEALRVTEQRLARKPDDTQLRFLRGVALAELGRTTEALAVFNKLVQDHPELPEPYNNMAVLYANMGQFDRARASLETAIRTNPTYSTAHENLGDLYAMLASQSYSKAMQLDTGNNRTPPKLAMIRDLMANKGQAPGAQSRAPEVPPAPRPAVAAAPAVPLPAAPSIGPAPVVAAAPAPMPAPPPMMAPAPSPAPQVASANRGAELVEQVLDVPSRQSKREQERAERLAREQAAKLERAERLEREKAERAERAEQAERDKAERAAKAAPETYPDGTPEAEVRKAVEAWAEAWASKDIKGYYAAYTAGFSGDAASREAWEETRKGRILGKRSITVKVSEFKIEVRGNQATAVFRQYYKGDALVSKSKKTLRLVQQGGQWRIDGESSG